MANKTERKHRSKEERNAIREIMKATGVKYAVAFLAYRNTDTEKRS